MDKVLKTTERLEKLESNIDKLVEIVDNLVEKSNTSISVSTVPTPKIEEISKAKPDDNPINPHWLAKAKEILGDYLEDVQVVYPPNGGTIFTLIIKKEKSNASQSHWLTYKQDRRSKEIGSTGLIGVEKWCQLVLKNLTSNINK